MENKNIFYYQGKYLNKNELLGEISNDKSYYINSIKEICSKNNISKRVTNLLLSDITNCYNATIHKFVSDVDFKEVAQLPKDLKN